MKRIIAFISGACFLAFSACSTISVETSGVCDKIPEGSYSVICDISEYLGKSPESVGKILKVGNLAGLAVKAYTAQEGMNYIEDIRAHLKNAQETGGLTYSALYAYAVKKYAALPVQVQLAIVLVEEISGVSLPVSILNAQLSDYDYAMLYGHLDEQAALLRPFLLMVIS